MKTFAFHGCRQLPRAQCYASNALFLGVGVGVRAAHNNEEDQDLSKLMFFDVFPVLLMIQVLYASGLSAYSR